MGSHEIIPGNDGNQGASFRNEALVFQEHSYTWEQVVRVLRKHSRLAVIVAAGLSWMVGIYASTQRDYYKPVARLEIAPPGGGISTLHEIESPVESENQDYLETQVQILGSDALAVSVIRALHLDRNPEFVSVEEFKDATARKDKDEESSSVAPGELAILQEQLDLANLSLPESIALERFRRNLSVAAARNSRLVEISFTSHVPQLAQSVTNTLVTKFIDQNYKHRYTTTMQASEWLSSQLTDLRNKVDESGQAVADYQKRYGLVEVDDRDVPMSQLMSEVNRQLSEAQANRIEGEAFVRMIDDGHGDAVPALRDDKLYQDLLGRYTDLRTQLAQARTIYGEANVNVKKLQDQLTEVSLQIDSERKRAYARSRSVFSAAKDRERLMMRERDKLRAKMAHMSSQVAAYHMLKTEANANVELYNTLQGRLREAGIYAGLRSSNMRVVDLATNLHKPSGPHRGFLFAFGVLGSALVGVVACFLREGFRSTVRTPDDVKSWIGLPSLALLPETQGEETAGPVGSRPMFKIAGGWQLPKILRSRNGNAEVEIMKAATVQSEAMRDLRTALLNVREGNAPRVILISSSLEGEGKTTVAVNFAIALAQVGRTCLLEGDLRQPQVAAALKIGPHRGLTDYLTGPMFLRDALVSVPGVDGLTVLPCGTIPDNPADLLSSPHMVKLIETLKQHYSFIVIDSPPVIRFSDARYLSGLADEVVLVGRYGVTTRRALQRTTELLSEMNASVAGIVLNGIDLSSPEYDYYSYGYGKPKNRRTDDSTSGTPPAPGPGSEGKPGSMAAHA
jgi:succinoglycan biosynthesis transport protein ExoP